MANTKISELPQLVGAPSDSDFLPIVDNSELVTKRILVSDLLINVPESGIDSATAQSIANAEIISTVDSAYVQSRQTTYGDADVTALVDASYVQSRQIVYGDADVTSLVDSNYVQTRIPLSGGYAINYDSSTGTISFDQSTNLTVNSLTTVGSAVIGGDLQVNGTTTTVNAVNLEVTDNMIYMNAGESAGSPVAFIDVGFAANVNETGSYAHTGFFRDASDNGTWKLFDGYQPEPDSAVQINTGHPSFSLASLQVDTMTATSYAGDGSQLTGMFDSADVVGIVDSAYVQLRQDRLQNLRDSGTGIVVTGNLHVESDLTVAGVATISGFDIGIQGDSVTGIGNIGIGEDVLINLTSGSENLVLGYLSGSAISTGSNNIVLGFNVQTTDSAASHEIVLGNDSNNRLRIPGLGLDTNNATNGQVLSWDSATSQFSWLTIPASGLDSAGVVSLVDSAYVQSRVTLDGVGLDSAAALGLITTTVDSAYVQSRVTLDGVGIDSATAQSIANAEILSVVDSAYIQTRQLIGGTGGLDSAGVTSLVDSAYVQLRQDRIENLYDSGTGIRITGSLVVDSAISVAGYQFTGLVGTPTNGAFITWDSAADTLTFTSIDSNNASIIALIDSDYVQARQLIGGTGGLDSAGVISLVDSAYVQLRQDRLQNLRDSGTGVVVTGNLHVESDLTVAGVATISGFDIGIQGDSVTGIGNIGIGEDVLINLTSGSENLVLGYLSGSAISTGSNNILLGFNVQTTDSAASHEIVFGNDSNNRLRIPGLGLDTNNATNGQVLSWDSAASQFSWLTIPASGLDSAGVVSLVDSAYVQSRVTLDGVGLDSAGVVTVLNNTTVGQFTDTLSTTIATIMGVGAVGLDIDDTVPNFTVAIGAYALDVASTGTANTAIGRLAGGSITTGSQNVAVGHESLDNTVNSITDNVSIGVTSAQGLGGSRNILVGTEAGYQAGITNNSVLIGYQAGKNVAGTGGGQNNNIVIGYQAAISAQNVSNEITLGNASIDRLRIPGLGLDTNDATDGQSLTWDSATGNFAWSTITAGASGIDSAAVVQLLSTGVNDVIPAADSAYDLGSPTNRWKDLYLSGNSIYLGDSAVISATGATLNVNGQPIATGTPTAASGGVRAFTAAETIVAGDVVVLNTDGTVAKVSSSGPTLGTPQTLVSSDIFLARYSLAAAYVSSNTIVFAYVTTTNNLRVVAATQSGDTFTVGSTVGVDSNFTSSFGGVGLASSGSDFLVSYFDPVANAVQIAAGTISGTTITIGTEVTVYSAGQQQTDVAYSTVDGEYLVVSTGQNGGSRMARYTVSGTTPTLQGSTVAISSTSGSEFIRVEYCPQQDVYVCAFTANNTDVRVVAISVSGGTITEGTYVKIMDATSEAKEVDITIVGSQAVVSAVLDNSTGFDYIAYGVVTITGTSLSLAKSETNILSIDANLVGQHTILYDSAQSSFVMLWDDYDAADTPTQQVKCMRGTMSASTLTFGSEFVVNPGDASLIVPDGVYNPDSQRLVFNYFNNTSNTVDVVSIDAGLVSDKANFVGIAAENIDSAASGNITIFGGVNEAVSGLTIGSNYYVSDEGLLTTAANDLGIVGRALDSDAIVIKL